MLAILVISFTTETTFVSDKNLIGKENYLISKTYRNNATTDNNNN